MDAGDNDLTRFLTYFAAAQQTIKSNIGQGALVALQSPGRPNIELILTALLNEIAEFPYDVALILDDYHVIESRPIDQTITFLLDHLPAQLHLFKCVDCNQSDGAGDQQQSAVMKVLHQYANQSQNTRSRKC